MEANPNDKIPDLIFQELIELYGQAKAEQIVNKKGIDFRYITMRIFAERFKRKYGINFWILCAIVIVLIFLSGAI